MSRSWLAFPPNRLPIVWAHIGVERLPVLIDTGSEVSMLSPTAAAWLKLTATGHGRIIGITGQVELVETTTVEGLGLAQIKLPPLKVHIVPLQRFGRKIEGILGINAFTDHKIQIDFASGKLYLLD